jgi:DNA adenine methylase
MNELIENSPFLKWAGGKRWLAPKLVPLIRAELDKSNGEYFEPFLGAGAIFFALAPNKASLSDVNANLIEVYLEIKRNWLAIVDEIKKWPVEEDFFYTLRKAQPSNRFERACRFLYLNRTCYGGLYRENQLGHFNVPYGGGRDHRALWEKNLLQRASAALQNRVSVRCADFELLINRSVEGDVVYCDPTYSTMKRTQFDRYGKTIFSWADQMRLAIAAEKAMDRGVLVIVSNSGCLHLNDFYPRAYKINLEKTKSIGNKAKTIAVHQESLYVLDPRSRRENWGELGKILNRKSRYSIGSSDLKNINHIDSNKIFKAID